MVNYFARDIHLGVQNKNGSYKTVRDDATVCEDCLAVNGWGYTVFADDVPAEKCEICGL